MIKTLALLLIMILGFGMTPAVMADDEEAVGVAGCHAIGLDPEASLEFQQNICNSAEDNPGTSCGASGHGRCSSPKYLDTLPDGKNCICIAEDQVPLEAPVEDTAVV